MDGPHLVLPDPRVFLDAGLKSCGQQGGRMDLADTEEGIFSPWDFQDAYEYHWHNCASTEVGE